MVSTSVGTIDYLLQGDGGIIFFMMMSTIKIHYRVVPCISRVQQYSINQGGGGGEGDNDTSTLAFLVVGSVSTISNTTSTFYKSLQEVQSFKSF